MATKFTNSVFLLKKIKHKSNKNKEKFLYQVKKNLFVNNFERKILVLDLDNTLVHTSLTENISRKHDFSIYMETLDAPFYVYKRPGLEYFLENLSNKYAIYLFTASLKQYADKVIANLKNKNRFSKRFYREHCSAYDGFLWKDLSRIGCGTANSMIIDDKEQIGNGILIKEWTFDLKNDQSLYKLLVALNIYAESDNLYNLFKGKMVAEKEALKKITVLGEGIVV
ncbi:hypothetical protein MHBO_000023 [Bonamia ostreae]|uniref:Mitochondrial import inner membrane translocase subunit TIM50 n=1 Tax=Bonamia ostreae TaxID=126728 RepID=A0ABV2AE69_9EUKA